MKRLFFLFLVLALPLSYAQTLLIGTTFENPPFNSIADQNGNFFGFDIDIMGKICQHLNLQCKFKAIDFNNLFTELKANKIDLAIAAIIITADREQQFLFSLPYLESSAQFITQQQSTLKTPEDLENKKIGVRLGTPFKALALSLYGEKVNIVALPRIEDLLDGLNNNTIDAVLMDAKAAKNWAVNNSSQYKLIGSNIPIGEGYGIMANQTQTQLIAQINQVLIGMEADGTYLKIYSRYFVD